jgi:sarcosine oxidase subunit alpha
MPRLKPLSRAVEIDLEGSAVKAQEGESVACALLAAGETVFSRSLKYHRPRGPWCMSGGCSHCLMRVDGVPNVFTCRTPARAGMRVERQNAYPSVKHDVFGAIDWLFPRGLDHHEMFAGVPVAEKVMARVARHLAGLGLLPDSPPPPRLPQQTLTVPVAVAGAGPAGLAAARTLQNAGVEFLALEREDAPGGRLLDDAPGDKDPPLSAFAPAVAGRVRQATQIIGLFTDHGGRYLGAVEFTSAGPRLLKVYAERFLLANGGHPALWPFDNNDVPGVMALRAVARLVRQESYLPGTRFALVGTLPRMADARRLLEGAGGRIAAEVAVDEGDAPLTVHGRTGVRGLSYRTAAGRKQRADCDAVVVCLPPSPAYELARQGGVAVRFDPAKETFVVEADADGRTVAPGIFVAGDLRGGGTAAQAADSGARAARALLGELGR